MAETSLPSVVDIDFSMLSNDDKRILMKFPIPKAPAISLLKKSALRGLVLGNAKIHKEKIKARTKKRKLVEIVLNMLSPVDTFEFRRKFTGVEEQVEPGIFAQYSILPKPCNGPSCTCIVSLPTLLFDRGIVLSHTTSELLRTLLKANKLTLEKQLASLNIFRNTAVPFCRIRTLVNIRNALENKEKARRERLQATAGSDSAAVQHHAENELYVSECVVCRSSSREVCFQPCGHVVCCLRCSHLVRNQCPMCRVTISSQLNIKLV